MKFLQDHTILGLSGLSPAPFATALRFLVEEGPDAFSNGPLGKADNLRNLVVSHLLRALRGKAIRVA